MKKLIVIPGDGIGPEITEQVIRVLKAIDAPFVYEEHPAGLEAWNTSGELLPESTLKAIEEAGLAIKGPTTTPVGKGHKSLNVSLRQHFDLYANVRPVKTLQGFKTHYGDIDLVIVRENTEDLYAGIERMVDADTAESVKRITRQGSRRIAQYAFNLAKSQGRKEVAVAHKANIMKLSDGLFLQCVNEVAGDYSEIGFRDIIIDNCCMQLVTRPQQFDVLVTQNLYGDILSDLCAGLVGGLGVVPGANIGEKVAIFEAVHGSAPDIAGQGKANPTALLQSAVMMLQHIGEYEKADRIMSSLTAALKDEQNRTADLGGSGSTASFTDRVIQGL